MYRSTVTYCKKRLVLITMHWAERFLPADVAWILEIFWFWLDAAHTFWLMPCNCKLCMLSTLMLDASVVTLAYAFISVSVTVCELTHIVNNGSRDTVPDSVHDSPLCLQVLLWSKSHADERLKSFALYQIHHLLYACRRISNSLWHCLIYCSAPVWNLSRVCRLHSIEHGLDEQWTHL